MGRSAGVSQDALFLVHSELDSEQRLVIIIFKVTHSLRAVELLCDIAAEVHCHVVLDGGNGHFLDALYREIDIEPVLAVI